MATEVGSLSIPITANTAALDRAAQQVASFGKSFDSSIKRLERTLTSFSKSIDSISQNLKGMSTASASASSKAEKAMASQARATILLKAETENLAKQFRATGQSKQFPELLATAARQLKALDAAFKKGTDSGVDFAKMTAKIEVNNKRLVEKTKQLTAAENQDSAAKKRLVAEADKVTKATKKTADAVDKLGQNEKKTEKDTKKLADQMTNLAKSVSVALGPLNGVAARITAITSLANRNTVAIAAMIGFIIALGSVFAKAVKSGALLERELLLLENRLKSTGRGGVEALRDLDEFAIKLGEDTLESASTARQALSILSAATEMTTGQMKEAAIAAADLASSGFGSIQISARRLVRAFVDPSSAMEGLARNGLKLTEQQRRMVLHFVELGKRGKAFGVILKEINKAVGGSGVAAAKGLSGAYDTLGERTTRFLEVLALEGGALSSVEVLINRVSDSLLEFTTNTDAARAAGNGFAILLDGINTIVNATINNIDILGAILGGLFVGAVLKGIIKFGKFLFGLSDKLKNVIGFVKKLVVVLVALSSHIVFIIAVTAAIVALIARIVEEESAQRTLGDALERVNKFRKEGIDIGGSQTSAGAILVDEIAKFAKDIEDLERNIDRLQGKIDRETTEGKSPITGIQTPQSIDTLAIFNRDLQKFEDLQGKIRDSQEELIKVMDKPFAGKTKEVVDETQRLSREQEIVLENINKQITATDQFGKRVRDLIKGGIAGGQVAFELAFDTAKAEQEVKDFLREIEQKVPQSANERLEEVAKDQIKATALLLANFKDIDIEANNLEEAFTKLFQKQRADALIQKFRNLELSTKLTTDAQNRLAIAVTQGGMAMRTANIESKVAAQMFRLGGDKALEFKDALEQLAIRADKAREALVTSQIVNALKEEISVTKTRIKFMGETELRQNQINALIEKEVDLRRRGIDTASAQAEIERQMVLNREKLNKQLELATERQQDLKSAINAMGAAFAGTLEDAIVDFKDLSDLINNLEKDLLRIITRVLITQPIERGIETAFAGVTDPTGISKGKGLEELFGKFGNIFDTRIDPTEGVTADTVGGVTEAVDEAMQNLTQSLPDAQAALAKLGEESGVSAIAEAAASAATLQTTGSMSVEKIAIDGVTASMLELTAAANIAAAAMASMGVQEGGDKLLQLGLDVLGSVAMGGGGIAPGTILGNTGASAAAGGIPLPKLAGGANFVIGGRGGVDRNLVQFMGTRGERVQVTPVSQKPSGGIKQTLIFNVSGDTTQTTVNQIAVTVGRHTQRAMSKGLA